MITQQQINVNVFESALPKWIAVIKGETATIHFTMKTESIYEIVEADTKEDLFAVLANRGITIASQTK